MSSVHQQAFVTDWFLAHESWIYSIIASIAIGFAGIFPLLVIPNIQRGESSNQDGSSRFLQRLLSFAVGSLLGDVFLHLLPEAWQLRIKSGNAKDSDHLIIGMCVLFGIFTFIIVEMLFSKVEDEEKKDETIQEASQTQQVNGASVLATGQLTDELSTVHKRTISSQDGQVRQNGKHLANGHAISNGRTVHSPEEKKRRIQVMGYLNLLANCIDNFTHGLAVAGSFLAGNKIGVLTTFAILIHEIPHEIGDFAILLRSGFTRWEAAKAQMLTATVGLLGALTALSVDSCESLSNSTVWILPFTAGGFLNIALVTVLPELLKEKDLKESFKQLGCVLFGIGIMAVMSMFCS